MLAYLPDKGPVLTLMDGNGDIRAALGVTPDGPSLELINDNHTTRARLMADKEKTRLVLNDDNGKPIWSAPYVSRVIFSPRKDI